MRETPKLGAVRVGVLLTRLLHRLPATRIPAQAENPKSSKERVAVFVIWALFFKASFKELYRT